MTILELMLMPNTGNHQTTNYRQEGIYIIQDLKTKRLKLSWVIAKTVGS